MHDLSAQVDRAADRTVIPRGLAGLLGLEFVDTIDVAGLVGGVFTASAYLVEVTIRGLSPQESSRPLMAMSYMFFLAGTFSIDIAPSSTAPAWLSRSAESTVFQP